MAQPRSPLRARDYEHMLDLAAAVLGNTDPAAACPLVVQHVQQTFECRAVTFFGFYTAERVLRTEAWAPDAHGSLAPELTRRHPTPAQHPLARHLMSGGTTPVVLDRISDRRRHSVWYDEAREYSGQEQLGLPVPGDPQALRSLVLGRSDAFTEQELTLAVRIQPLLLTMERHICELRRLRTAVAPPPAPAPTAHDLTPRELTVLGLLAEGLTAEGIARRLLISPSTVNRHLEKVYRKLGTNNRVSTVLLAKREGLVA
ncbi:hypothetical protein GCM10010218_27360 [Streptomyces mashuensis]|uniref:HTH luxR-type domain-containing protein n=1 Tax=Streptomyces mashuensis TaxID=33904 RepID=A0A919ECX4_9ACTN|nr:LuxR C-terminal-related transcriptional regulator [Streptomyces mashuensis]GHF44513.1 hypothetical protein GCM10010218_27360 [Streptomyces mashuensis]